MSQLLVANWLRQTLGFWQWPVAASFSTCRRPSLKGFYCQFSAVFLSTMSSPQRPETTMTRPEWPWSATYPRASRPPTSTPSLAGSYSSAQSWDPRSSSATSSPATVFVSSGTPSKQISGPPSMAMPPVQQHGIRNWTFAVGFVALKEVP